MNRIVCHLFAYAFCVYTLAELSMYYVFNLCKVKENVTSLKYIPHST